MINHKGTRMAKDGEDFKTPITNDEFEKLRLNFSIRANLD